MDLKQIETKLNSSEFQDRLTAVKALREYPAEIAIPLLLNTKEDEQFLIRSLVAMGLGRQKSPESFNTLLEMMQTDNDHNVRAEAANSLSLFGQDSISHLRQAFEQDNNWLVRLSVLAALMDLNCSEEVFEVCLVGIDGEDDSVKQTCIGYLGLLVGTEKEEEALTKLINLSEDSVWQTRLQVVEPLTKFSQLKARQALEKLKQDSDHRVVASVLENTINNN